MTTLAGAVGLWWTLLPPALRTEANSGLDGKLPSGTERAQAGRVYMAVSCLTVTMTARLCSCLLAELDSVKLHGAEASGFLKRFSNISAKVKMIRTMFKKLTLLFFVFNFYL